MKFDSYHPAINLIYFTASIACTVYFRHPVFLAISYISAFLYSVKLNGRKALIFNICLMLLVIFYAGFYSYYNHFGVTVLRRNFIDNQVTLEAAAYGLATGAAVAAVIMIMSCVFAVFSSDKVVYLFGKISPRLSLFLSILLRTVPRLKKKASGINISQYGIGMSVKQGDIAKRCGNCVRLISILITWLLESFIESSLSMKSRGYSLKGRTSFSIYRFDNRDRAFAVVLFLCMTLTAMAIMLDQALIYYDPEIVMNRITPMSVLFYAAYAVFMLLPLLLQTVGEIRFKSAARIDTKAFLIVE